MKSISQTILRTLNPVQNIQTMFPPIRGTDEMTTCRCSKVYISCNSCCFNATHTDNSICFNWSYNEIRFTNRSDFFTRIPE